MSSPSNGSGSAPSAAPSPGQAIGKKLRLFQKGRSAPSLFSASDMNELVKALNAFLNFSIKRGPTDEAILSESNFVLQLATDSGGTGGGGLTMYRLKSVQGDYVTLRTWDGTTEGARDVLAAKEYKLRTSLTGETIGGTAHTYSYGGGLDANNVTRTDDDGTENEQQIVVPPWVVNEVVYAIAGTTGVMKDGVDVGNLLIRTGAWARSTPLQAPQVGI